MAETRTPATDASQPPIDMLKERYKCPHFRILVIGRANAGKTTILEKVCGVARGTKPIVYDGHGVELKGPSVLQAHLNPTVERGIHDIESQITYPGSNFIFHDSQGFESGDNKELHDVWNFIEKRNSVTAVKDQLHAIWYCIPMDSARPILSSELEFFNEGTGKVPLVTIFTKFDAQVIQQYGDLDNIMSEGDRWVKARENASRILHEVYLSKILNTNYPPRAYVQLEDMDLPETDCHEVTETTANAIDDSSLYDLFVSTQRNNLDLCVKLALEKVLLVDQPKWEKVLAIVLPNFPNYWLRRKNDHVLITWASDKKKIFPRKALCLVSLKKSGNRNRSE